MAKRGTNFMHNNFPHRDLGNNMFLAEKKSWLSRALIIASLLFGTLLLQSSVMAAEVTMSGFMTVVGAKVLSGSSTTPSTTNGLECPCYIASWGNLETYNQNVSFKQESRVGVRMNAKIDESWAGVVQVDGRTASGGKGSLEWAYVTYTPTEDWMVQAGRKRLPIYYYSDFMDVGFAYPWVRAPTDLYGWEVDNFNGVTLVKSGRWNDWSSRASLFYGNEESKANILSSWYYSYTGESPNLIWRDIVGADWELTRDWFNIRLVHIESKVDLNISTGPIINSANQPIHGAQQRINGMSVNFDFENWFMRSEFSLFDRWRDMGYRSSAWMVGIGERIGKYTPMLTYSEFADEYADGTLNSPDTNLMATLRYDINATSSLKAQYDVVTDLSKSGTSIGSAKILSVSFDKVF